MKKMIFIIFALLILLYSITIQLDKNQLQNNEVETINYCNNGEGNNYIDCETTYIKDEELLLNLFQGLLKQDENGNIIPALAQYYSISADGLEYKFKIKDNIYYSNGHRITADDFIEFYKKILQDNNNDAVKYMDCVFGVKEYKEGKRNFSQVAINKGEFNTLIFRLNYRNPYFLDLLAHPQFSLRDYEKSIKDYKLMKYTGPFIVDKIENNSIILIKNSKYYNADKVADYPIKISYSNSLEEPLAEFELGKENGFSLSSLDIVKQVPIYEYQRLNNDNNIKSFKGNTVYYLGFNLQKSISGDVNFRKAINGLLSKEYYSQIICNSIIEPASSYIYGKYNYNTFYKYGDKKVALNYYEKVKKNMGDNIILIYENNTLNKYIVDTLAEDIKEDLNLKLECRGYDNNEFKKVIKNGDYHMILEEKTMRFNNPLECYTMFTSHDTNNLIGYKNYDYDNLINAIWNELDEDNRKLMYEQCEKILKKDIPYIPIYYKKLSICTNNRIEGLYMNRYGYLDFENIKKLPN